MCGEVKNSLTTGYLCLIFHVFQINCINGYLIKSQSSIKYLGIDIDKKLSGARTANTIFKKVILFLDLCMEKQIVYLLKQEEP